MLTEIEYNRAAIKLYNAMKEQNDRAEVARTLHYRKYCVSSAEVYRNAYMNLRRDTTVLKRELDRKLERAREKLEQLTSDLQRRKMAPKYDIAESIAIDLSEQDGIIYACKQVMKLL